MQGQSGVMKILIDIERVDVKYLKHVLNLISCTLNYIVYGETRHFSLYVTIYTRMFLFLANIINTSENKLSKIAYLDVRNTILYFIH